MEQSNPNLLASESNEALRDAFFQVGVDIFQAIHEKAYEIGGDKLAEKATTIAFKDFDLLPNVDAIELLMTHDPNAGSDIMNRSEEIGKERQLLELKSISRNPLRLSMDGIRTFTKNRQRAHKAKLAPSLDYEHPSELDRFTTRDLRLREHVAQQRSERMKLR